MMIERNEASTLGERVRSSSVLLETENDDPFNAEGSSPLT